MWYTVLSDRFAAAGTLSAVYSNPVQDNYCVFHKFVLSLSKLVRYCPQHKGRSLMREWYLKKNSGFTKFQISVDLVCIKKVHRKICNFIHDIFRHICKINYYYDCPNIYFVQATPRIGAKRKASAIYVYIVNSFSNMR